MRSLVRLLGRMPSSPGSPGNGRFGRAKDVLVNIGCGPFGQDGWVNLDLFPAPGVTVRVDCRRHLPLGDGAARGIHVEHYLEHLEPTTERARFLAECRRCLEPGGVLRIVVPDMRKYIEAYLAPGWGVLNEVGCGGELPQATFATKIEALNHVFVQDGEHYGGFDAEYLRRTLEQAGFADIEQVGWREGASRAVSSIASSTGLIRSTWRRAADAPAAHRRSRDRGAAAALWRHRAHRRRAGAPPAGGGPPGRAGRQARFGLSGRCLLSLARRSVRCRRPTRCRTAWALLAGAGAISGPTWCTASRASPICCRICADRCRS